MDAINREHVFTLVHPADRKRFTVPDNPMIYQRLSPEESGSMAMFAVSAAPGQSTGSSALKHAGDEALLVLSGSFEIEVEGEKSVLGPGDSVFIPRGRRHHLSNIGTQAGEAVFVLSPPEY